MGWRLLLMAAVAACALGGATAQTTKPLLLEDPLSRKTYNIDDLRKKLGYESLVDRLAYETKFPQRRVAMPKELLDSEEWKRIEQSEQTPLPFGPWRYSQVRAEALEKLHSDKVEDFVKRNGFGVVRALVPSPSLWELPVAQAIPNPRMPSLPESDSTAVPLPPRDVVASQRMRWPGVALLEGLHTLSRTDFVNPPGFGHVKDRAHVSGFQEHHFRGLPDWKRAAGPAKESKETWLVRRLELVSLLKHESPVAYVDDHLPRMQALRREDVKVRELNDFEGRALKGLENGKGVLAEATANRIRMLGAIRATKQCLKCHDAQRGDLLGAFSYELQREPLFRGKE
jgi:hypothetical protein